MFSGKDFSNHPALDVGQPEIATTIAMGEFLVLQAREMQHGGVEVVDRDTVYGRVVSKVVGFAIGDTSLDASTGHPKGKTPRVVIATVATLGERSATKLACPYN